MICCGKDVWRELQLFTLIFLLLNIIVTVTLISSIIVSLWYNLFTRNDCIRLVKNQTSQMWNRSDQPCQPVREPYPAHCARWNWMTVFRIIPTIDLIKTLIVYALPIPSQKALQFFEKHLTVFPTFDTCFPYKTKTWCPILYKNEVSSLQSWKQRCPKSLLYYVLMWYAFKPTYKAPDNGRIYQSLLFAIPELPKAWHWAGEEMSGWDIQSDLNGLRRGVYESWTWGSAVNNQACARRQKARKGRSSLTFIYKRPKPKGRTDL